MLTIPLLTPAQLESFKTDGFLVVRGGLPGDEIKMIKTWTDELLAMPEETGKH